MHFFASLLAMAAEGNRRTADVRCKGFTNLFILSKNEFEGAMKDYPDAHKLLKKRAKYVTSKHLNGDQHRPTRKTSLRWHFSNLTLNVGWVLTT